MSAEVNPLNLQPGTMVQGWRIVRPIGKGAYAVVYEVEYEGKRFALKLACHTERSLDPRQVNARAEREVACLQQLKHPHIIRMRGHGKWPHPSEGFLFIVLDFVDGYTLARWAERTAPTPHDFAVLFLKLFDAADYMHGHGVFHRDLSVNNIMVTQDGEPVIIDFGVADYATADQLTDGPIPPGTPRNRSPQAHRFWEQNRHTPGAHYTFTAADEIFALGADFYDLLTDPTPTRSLDRPPLGGELMEPPSPWRVTQGRVPADLSGFAMKLISHDPEERYPTGRAAKRVLEEFVRNEDPEWRAGSVHPARAQLPPERPEGAPWPVQAQNDKGPREPSPLPPLAVQGPPVEPAAAAAAQKRSRYAWLRPTLVGPLLALAALAVLMLASLLHRPAQPQPDQPPASSTLAEKPTRGGEQLASPLPTQKDASPSVKQSDNSPTLTHGTPNAQQGQKTTKRRPSKAEVCTLLIATLEWFGAGCSGVQTRPDPEDCPKESVTAMRQELGWDTEGGGTQPLLIVDVTKAHSVEEMRTDPLTVFKDGPVTGGLIRAEGKAPVGTRLDGHLWTTGDRIYGRYLRAHLPGGRIVPICVELKDSVVLGADKQEGSKPGHTVGDKVSGAVAVERWR